MEELGGLGIVVRKELVEVYLGQVGGGDVVWKGRDIVEELWGGHRWIGRGGSQRIEREGLDILERWVLDSGKTVKGS